MGQAEAMEVEVSREDRYWYPDEGGAVWLAGYQLVDPESGSFLGRDAPQLAERGLRVCGVAGAGQHPAEAPQAGAAAPRQPPRLERDPDKPPHPHPSARPARQEP